MRTYIQSGNVVFTARSAVARRMAASLSQAIADRLGLTVPVVLRSVAQLRAVVDDNPFLAQGVDPQALHVAFLADAPGAELGAALDPDRSPPDALVLRGAALFLHLSGGVAKTTLTNAYLDRVLQTTCTLRNWRTVLTLAEMAQAQA